MAFRTIWIIEYRWMIGYKSTMWWPGTEVHLTRRVAREEKRLLEGDKKTNNVKYRVAKYKRAG